MCQLLVALPVAIVVVVAIIVVADLLCLVLDKIHMLYNSKHFEY